MCARLNAGLRARAAAAGALQRQRQLCWERQLECAADLKWGQRTRTELALAPTLNCEIEEPSCLCLWQRSCGNCGHPLR